MDERLTCLNHLRTGSPYNKPCLLLAVICEIQSGHIVTRRVQLDQRLLARYHDLYELVSGERHKATGCRCGISATTGGLRAHSGHPITPTACPLLPTSWASQGR